MHIKRILKLIRDRLLAGCIRTVVTEEMQAYLKRRSLYQYSVFGDESRLEIASTAVVNNALFNPDLYLQLCCEFVLVQLSSLQIDDGAAQ